MQLLEEIADDVWLVNPISGKPSFAFHCLHRPNTVEFFVWLTTGELWDGEVLLKEILGHLKT